MSNGHLNRSAEKEAFWRRHLVGQSSSGLSVRSYCRLHGLSSPLFYVWRRVIQKRDAEQAGPGRVPLKRSPILSGDSGRKRSTGAGSTSPVAEKCSVGGKSGSPIRPGDAGLIALEVIGDSRFSVATPLIEIACPGGPVIRLREDASVEVLERVMAACRGTQRATSDGTFSFCEVRSC